MRKKFTWGLSAVLSGSLLFLVGCGGGGVQSTTSSTGSTGSANGTINIGLNADPPKLDPAFSSSLYDRQVFQSIFDKLVDLDGSGNIIPMLAEKWDVSPDQKSYTFHLRQGVKFQDGTDFNADAVKFNFERDMDKGSTRKNELQDVTKVTVVDPNTVKVDLDKPFAPFLSILTDRSGMMVSPAAVQKYGQDFMNHPVGTGPFVFKDRVKGSTITLEKNPNYWQRGLPKSDKIVYKIIDDANVELTNLKSGQLDFTDVFPAKEIAAAKTDPKLDVVNQPGYGYAGFYLNTSKAPFDKKEVRQAVDLMIDRDSIVSVLTSGSATPAHSPFSPAHFSYGDSDKAAKPDVAKAKALLQKAGVSNLSFTLKIGTSTSNLQLGSMVQNMLKPAGIDVKLEKVEFGTLLDQTDKGNYEASALSWSGRPDPDQNLYDFYATGGAQNDSKYSNKEVDQLLLQARSNNDQAKRKALYDKLMTILNDDIPYVYIYHQPNTFGVSKSLHGFNYVPDGMIRTLNMSK